MTTGHGSKFARKKEQVIAALLSHRNAEEAAQAAGISVSTLKRWMQLPEFKAAYLQARREVVSLTNARLQQNSGAAASVLLKLMADPTTAASVRARAAQSILEAANKSLALEDLQMRVLTDAAGNPAGTAVRLSALRRALYRASMHWRIAMQQLRPPVGTMGHVHSSLQPRLDRQGLRIRSSGLCGRSGFPALFDAFLALGQAFARPGRFVRGGSLRRN